MIILTLLFSSSEGIAEQYALYEHDGVISVHERHVILLAYETREDVDSVATEASSHSACEQFCHCGAHCAAIVAESEPPVFLNETAALLFHQRSLSSVSLPGLYRPPIV